MRWFKLGKHWHILVEPRPSLHARMVCGFEPPALVVDQEARDRLPWRAHVCPVCRTAYALGKRIDKWVPA